jgi:methyl-accepting chemotaxis protein
MRWLRDLSISGKLGLSAGGAFLLLGVLVWSVLGALTREQALQAEAAAAAQAAQQIGKAAQAAGEMRTIAQGLHYRQTLRQIRETLAQAGQAGDAARTELQIALARSKPGPEHEALTQALARLKDATSVVKHEFALRRAMLDIRDKHFFDLQPRVNDAIKSVTADLASENLAPPQIEALQKALGAYGAAQGDIARIALNFLATGNPALRSHLADATARGQEGLKVLQGTHVSDAMGADIAALALVGNAFDGAAKGLLEAALAQDEFAAKDGAAAYEALASTFQQSAALFNAQSGRDQAALAASAAAFRSRVIMLAGAIAVLLLVSAWLTARAVARPIAAMTSAVQRMADGDTAIAIGFAGRRDEIGRMAVALEKLRVAVERAFVQGQMIEQIPVGVMTAEGSGDFRITFLNPEALRIMHHIGSHLPVAPEELVGTSIDVMHHDPAMQRTLLSDPDNLPHRARISLGNETLDLKVSAIRDPSGAYVGPMITWQVATRQADLAAEFERSVGAIAQTVGASADSMRLAAEEMSATIAETGGRAAAVSAASDQAAGNVQSVAAGAEELAASVAEISRQVAESARIASQAVKEAEATDACVAGLSDAANRIDDVVRLIGDIAGRTNLLALNATIEAARAGEAGKGFAVVATEVKTLATQTARATGEIGSQISAMQSATGQAVTALRSIAATIQRMNEIATAIAGAVEEQGAATREIARSVQEAAAGTSEVTGNINQVSRAVEETGARSSQVLDASGRLSEQAETLKQQVGRFLQAMQEAA